MAILVLSLGGTFDLGLAALLDTLAVANDLAHADESTRGLSFAPSIAGVRRRVRTAHGLTVPIAPLPRRRPDVVIVPALGCKTPDTLTAALRSTEVGDALDILRRWAERGSTVCAACTGTFVLASSGLLDGGRATTTWWLSALFRQMFEDIELDESQMVVESGRCVTAGAALAHVDLALWLVRRESPALADMVARYLMVDPRPSPVTYAIPDHIAHQDDVVSSFERWVRERLDQSFSLVEAARAVGTSERTLSRRMQRVLGRSPIAYVQDLRVERALHLLRTTDQSVDEIAGRVGYADGVTLRTLLRKKTGRGVRELRARTFARS